VDVIVADGNPATRTAQGAGGTTPIVFISNDPVGSGLVASLSRPGGRSTGVSLSALERGIGAKQLELLLTFAPGTRTVAVLSNPGNPTALPIVDGIRAAAPAAKVEVLSLHATSVAEIENAFVEMKKRRAGALLWVRDAFLNSQRCQIAELAAAHHLPSIGGVRTFTVCGGLMSYGSNGTESMRRMASYVDKILKGENPGILPVEQASKLELLINRKTAKALGLPIPPELLLLADRVIE